MMTDGLYATALEIRILSAVLAKTARRALEQRADLAQAGISGLQYWIMHALSCRGHTISELSHGFMLDPSTLVPAVDALERKGFVKRGRDPSDRRRVPLSLTEQGGQFVSCAPSIDENDPLLKSLRVMGDEPSRQLLALLRAMVRHLPRGEHILRQVSSRVNLQAASESVPRENTDKQ
jgi:DNA-binding MarR family transcriptional regulator